MVAGVAFSCVCSYFITQLLVSIVCDQMFGVAATPSSS